MDDFSINNNYPPPLQDAFSIDTGDFNTPVSSEVASARAVRAQYGLNNIVDKPVSEIQDQIQKGNEGPFRQEVASTLDAIKDTDAANQIKTIAASKPVLNPQDKQRIINIASNRKPSDPNSIFEDTFAVNYVNNVYTVNGSNPYVPKFSWLQDAISIMPDKTQDFTDLATTAVAKHMYSRQMEEDAAEATKNQPWFGTLQPNNTTEYSVYKGYIPDFIKNLSVIYPNVKLRGLVEGLQYPEEGALSLAGALDKQRLHLYSLPYDEYKVEYKRVMDALKEHPLLQQQFSRAMTGLTTDETNLSNLFDVAVPFEAFGVAKISLQSVNALRNLGKSMVRSAGSVGPEAPKVAAAAGVGDLSEAAVQKASQISLEELSGAPNETKRAIEALTTNFRVDKAEVASNPGRFGQDIVNRIHDIYNSGENSLIQAITTWNRVNRTPVAVSDEQVIRAIAERQRGELKGIDNAILDTQGPFHEPVSNTYVYEHKIGTPDGEYFKDRQTAVNNANLNGLVVRPSLYSELNDLNQQIGKLRKSGQFQKPGESLQDIINKRDAFKEQYKEELKSPGAVKPGTEGFDIRQNDAGAGWYINVTKTLPETSDVVRDSLITTKFDTIKEYRKVLFGDEVSTSLPPGRAGGFFNYIGGKYNFRTPEETLSKQERASRRTAVASTSKVLELIDANKSALKELPVKYYKDFDRILTAAQHKRDPLTAKPGYFEKSPGDLDALYQRTLGRQASDVEVSAYFEFKKLIEFDRVFREMANMRNRARAGTESHSVKVLNSDGEKVNSPFFDGIRQPHVPGGEDTVMVMGDKLGEETFFKANDPNFRVKHPDLAKDVVEGKQRVIRLWNPEDYPFRDFSTDAKGKKVRYVIGKDFDTQPLSWSSINRTGGGHLMPEYERYIKQPIVNREFVGNSVVDHYHGDQTLMPIQDLAVGEQVIKDANQVRELLHNGDTAGAKQAHMNSKSLPFDWEEHLGWYQEGRSPDGKSIPARFNTKYPFQMVPKDTLIVDMDNSLRNLSQFKDPYTGKMKDIFVDGTRSGSDARMSAIEFTGARDAYDLKTITREIGSQGNPIYSFQPVKYVDPITTMDRGLSRIVNTTIMDDYKFYAAEHWLQQAAPHLNASLEEIRSAPQYWFNKGEFLPGTPLDVKWTLNNTRQRAKAFIGTASDTDAFMNRAAQKLSDGIYNTTGSSKGSLIPMKLWPYVRDPIGLIRGWTYHLGMGFYNINTFFTQAATFANIFALSPRYASSGAIATVMHTISSFNRSEEILNGLDKFVVGFNNGPVNKMGLRIGWKPGWWKEANSELVRSGFATVGHENAFLDTPSNVNILNGLTKNPSVAATTSAASQIVDAGLIPFRYGAASTRVSGYYTAFLEWREANPTKAITRFDREQILQRADLLDHNMSRASNSNVHTGVMSFPMQFEAYSIRLAEMLSGKRLTPLEKTRLFATSSLIYGARYGGIGLTAIPVGTWLYQQAKDKLDYTPGQNAGSTLALEGALTMLGAFISGKGDWKTGDLYDFQRWGTKGIDTIDTAMSSDKTFWDVIGGAPLSKMKDIVNFGTPLMRAVTSMFIKDDPNFPKAWKVTSDDLIDMARIIGTGNKIRQTIIAVNTQKWTSKNEVYTTDVSKLSAFFLGITGVNPTEQQDIFDKEQWMHEQTKLQKDALFTFAKEWRRGIDSYSSKDETAGDKHMSNAWASLHLADYPSDKYGEAVAFANQGLESKLRTVNERYYIKNLPDNRMFDKLQTLDTIQNMNAQRGKK